MRFCDYHELEFETDRCPECAAGNSRWEIIERNPGGPEFHDLMRVMNPEWAKEVGLYVPELHELAPGYERPSLPWWDEGA